MEKTNNCKTAQHDQEVQSLFENELKRIALCGSKKNINNLVLFEDGDREYKAFIFRCLKHLKMAGVSVTAKHSNQFTNTTKLALKSFANIIRFPIQRVNCQEQVNYEPFYFIENNNYLNDKYSIPTISIHLIPTKNYYIIEDSDKNGTIVLNGYNYYFLVFAILKNILPSVIDSNIVNFKHLYDRHKFVHETVKSSPISISYFVNISKMFAIVLLILFVIASSLMFINFKSHKNYMHSPISDKYLEYLEEENIRMGHLENSVQKLKFFVLKNGFKKASHMLLALDEHTEKTNRLVNFLQRNFPLVNKTNEKIHKLFFAMAAYYGKLEFMKRLSESENISFIDFKDYYGHTSLMLAAAGNRINTFEWLFNKDSPLLNHKNLENNSALILATLSLSSDEHLTDNKKNESIAIIEGIVEEDQNNLITIGHKECTPILVAGAKGNITAIQYFLNKLAPNDVDKQLQILEHQKNIDGNNILLLAAYNGRKNVIEWLHKKGMNFSSRNKYNTTAFMQAASGGNIDVMNLIYNINDNNTQNILMEQNDFGQTALFLAAYENKKDIFKWLLEKIKTSHYNNNDQSIVNYIKSARNFDGDSLLHIFVKGSVNGVNERDYIADNELLNLLLNYIDINTRAYGKARHGETALMIAANNGNLSMVKKLVEKYGANIDETNSTGKTALYFAAIGGKEEFNKVIEYLWAQKAIKDRKNINEIRAQTSNILFLGAVEHGQKIVMEWLLKKEPDLIESHTSNGENVLSLATKSSDIDIIEFIFNWDKKTAIRLANEKRTNVSESVLEQLILEEKNGFNRSVSLGEYLEKKVGFVRMKNEQKTSDHGDTQYKWKSLEIGIKDLSTSSIQPWSPYYID